MIPKEKIAEWKALVETIDEEETGKTYVLWQGSAVDARHVIPALLAEREEMLALLREMEFTYGDLFICYACGGEKPPEDPASVNPRSHGHAPSCRIAAFLKEE